MRQKKFDHVLLLVLGAIATPLIVSRYTPDVCYHADDTV